MIQINDRKEFIGQIVDIFEDICTADSYSDPCMVYFVGKKYDSAASALCELMTNWGIFSNDQKAFDKERILENIVEMSTLFQHLLDKELLHYEDPRTHQPTLSYFIEEVEKWAIEFDQQFDDIEDDYFLAITAFAENKFHEMGWLVKQEE